MRELRLMHYPVAIKHFTDQAHRWAIGDLRTVYFWPEQIKQHAVRTYHPGQ